MQFLVVNRTKLMSGAHASTMLVNDYVNARLRNYGPGVGEVWVILLYPPKSGVKRSADPLGEEFFGQVKRAVAKAFWGLLASDPTALANYRDRFMFCADLDTEPVLVGYWRGLFHLESSRR